MTYVIAEPCIGVKDAACVDVCPVDCIYESEEHNMLLISPKSASTAPPANPSAPSWQSSPKKTPPRSGTATSI